MRRLRTEVPLATRSGKPVRGLLKTFDFVEIVKRVLVEQSRSSRSRSARSRAYGLAHAIQSTFANPTRGRTSDESGGFAYKPIDLFCRLSPLFPLLIFRQVSLSITSDANRLEGIEDTLQVPRSIRIRRIDTFPNDDP